LPKLYFTLLTLTGGLLLACGGASLSPRDIEGVGLSANSIANAPEERAFTMLIEGFAQVPMGRSNSCMQHLSDTTQASEAYYHNALIGAYLECGGTCPAKQELNSYARLAWKDKLPTLLNHCDATGPDPLFSGALAQERASFRFGDYILLRLHVDHLTRAANNNGSSEASAVLAEIQALAPRIAASMKARGLAEKKEMEEEAAKNP
jgi:hypothetical protein